MTLLLLLVSPLFSAALGWLLPRRAGEWGQLAGATLTLGLVIGAAASVSIDGPIDDGLLYLDPLGALLALVVALVAWGGALYAVDYVRDDIHERRLPAHQAGPFYLWYHLFGFTMLAVVTTDNLGILWAAVEATTLASAVLVGFYRTPEALEAAWKYLILCTVGISFALFGVLLLYAAGAGALGPGESAMSWRVLAANASRLDPELVRLAFVFILIGFGTKVGFAPLHTWLPDAHSQAPTPVSAVLSGVLLPCALYGIMRVQTIANGTLGPELPSLLLIGFGLLSAAVAVPFVLVQHDLKRLLAYSSIEHMGIIAVALGIGGPLALFAALLHLVVHALGKALLFFAAGTLAHRYGTRDISRIRGAVRALPLSGTALLAGGLAVAGAPPFGLFISELSVLAAGFARGHTAASAALAACIALVFVGLLFNLGRVTLGDPGSDLPRGERGIRPALLGGPLLLIFLLGLWVPPPLSDALTRAAAVVAGHP